ncbi:MAG: signal peptidase I [Allosphingosinicella sp.]
MWARLGLAALNILAPGAGMLRLGEGRLAAAFLIAPLASVGAVLLLFAALPELSFGALLVVLGLLALVTLGALVGAIVLTWMRSAHREAPRPPYARWYVILLAVLGTIAAGDLLATAAHRFYKPFYLPSEAMAPTLLKNDRIVAAMWSPSAIRRGEVILFRLGSSVYVKRVAGLPGDRIAVRNGVVTLNDIEIPQRYERDEPNVSSYGPPTVRRLRETFPGEGASHEIYDAGPSPEDDYPETLVAPGHLFVLGDNRDNSADSRVARADGGVEQLPVADVLGRALYYSYGPSHRAGQRINPE